MRSLIWDCALFLYSCGGDTKNKYVEHDENKIYRDGELLLQNAKSSDNLYSREEKREVIQSEFDFKKSNWGDTEDDVIAIEGEPDIRGEMNGLDAYYIAYEATAVGKDALLVYYFCDDGLFCTKYIFTESHSNENLYIDDYNW